MKGIKFNIITGEYYANQQYATDKACNAVIAINKGNTPVRVNQFLLMPSPLNVNPGDQYGGESITFGGNIGEIYEGRVDIAFPEPVGTEPCVFIIEKFYTNTDVTL